MKSFYASVECVARGMNPLRANLLVADSSRSDQTICLAVSPALKAIGVPGRPRLFEAKQAIKKYENTHNTRIEYEIAVPRMAMYEQVSATIYSVYLRYVDSEDIHVYSIDECFIDCTPYLHLYETEARAINEHPAHSNGTVRPDEATNSTEIITDRLTTDFDKKTDHRLLYRRLGVCACEVYSDNGIYQLNLFADYNKIDKERRLQCAMQEVRTKYGANAILRGINFLEDATTRERNMQIGGHRA